MFTLDQIKAAHSKVKSGADFPAYIQEMKSLGVVSYALMVADGHTEYKGTDEYLISSPARYMPLTIAATADEARLRSDLKAHQAGQTDFLTFCTHAANAGIEKWVVNMEAMTCTYYDRNDKEIIVEAIPG